MLFLLSILIRFVWMKPNSSACSMWLHRPYEQQKEEYINLRFCDHSPQNNVFR